MKLINRQPVSVWENPVPLAMGTEAKDIPTIIPYFPKKKITDHAVIVFPGGGYRVLAEHEGKGYAEYLAANGITAFVLNYRLGTDGYRHPAMIFDACKAVRLVRKYAEELEIDPDKIGVMGSSAGGHLAAICSTVPELALFEADEDNDGEAGRPDFTILAYPVISGTSEQWRHFGSFQAVLGDVPDPKLLQRLSPEQNVNDNTPPAFIWHTFEDTCVPMENSMAYVSALRQFNIPCELHIYEKGPHGIGLGKDFGVYLPGEHECHPWGAECIRWILSLKSSREK